MITTRSVARSAPRRTTLAALVLIGAVATPLGAQQTTTVIRSGETVTGALTVDDARLDDDSRYHVYTFSARAGEAIRITLRSTDFDAYLYFGDPAGPDCEEYCRQDDDSGGGTDAQIRVPLRYDGIYQIMVNTLNGDEIGAYSLSVEPYVVAEPVILPISLGETVTGELTDEHPMLDDGSYYAVYRIRSAVGERIRITLRSDEFDAYLLFGLASDDECEECLTDDDGAGEGTDARIDTTILHDGDHHIIVNTLDSGETGRYTLTVEPSPTPASSDRSSTGRSRSAASRSAALEADAASHPRR